jgi:hypothetical protein
LQRIFPDSEVLEKYVKDGKVTSGFIKHILEFLCSTDSIFCVQLLQEYLSLDENFLRKIEEKSFRINFPGVINDENWTAVLPGYLEDMYKLDINTVIKEMNVNYKRV